MARRYNIPYKGRKYLADKNAQVIHNLDNESTECQIDAIKVEDFEMRSSIFDVRYIIEKQGYTICPHCLSSIIMVKPS